MFKLSLAFSAALVAGQVTLSTYCAALATQCPGHSMTAAQCATVMAGTASGTPNEEDKDTLDCRYKFLNNAAFMGGNACSWAGPTGGGRCGQMLTTTCRVATDVCTGADAAFPTAAACRTGLAAVTTTTGVISLQHQWGNKYGASAGAEQSLECYVYHAIASVLTGDTVHCGHFTNNGTSPCFGAIQPSVSLYCDTLQRSCGNGTTANAQFAMNAQCNVTARSYPFPVTDDARQSNGANSLGCRNYHAWASAASPAVHCEHAGPSGAGVCGFRRDAWASILAGAPCMDDSVVKFNVAVPAATVDLLVPTGAVVGSTYSTTFDTDKNTQTCRIYHLGVASTLPATGATSHCSHGTVSGSGLCGAVTSNLCKFIETACTFGTNTSWQFADNAACLAALAVGPTPNNITQGVSIPLDTAFNTQECRFYHAGVAASFVPGGAGATAAGAAAQATRQLHCSHVLGKAAAGGCGATGGGTAPTNAPAPTMKSSASALSVAASVTVLFFSL